MKEVTKAERMLGYLIIAGTVFMLGACIAVFLA